MSERGREERYDQKQDRVATDRRHSRFYTRSLEWIPVRLPANCAWTVLGPILNGWNCFGSPADLFVGIQASKWPSRLHPEGSPRPFSVIALYRAGRIFLSCMPCIAARLAHRCRPRTNNKRVPAFPVIRKSKGATPAPPQ